MDMIACPDCGGWDVTDYANGEYQCLECGVTFQRETGSARGTGGPAMRA